MLRRRGRMTRYIETPRPMRVACPLNHEWDAMLAVVDRGVRRREGRRPHRVFEHVAEPERCVTCGHRWARACEPVTPAVQERDAAMPELTYEQIQQVAADIAWRLTEDDRKKED